MTVSSSAPSLALESRSAGTQVGELLSTSWLAASRAARNAKNVALPTTPLAVQYPLKRRANWFVATPTTSYMFFRPRVRGCPVSRQIRRIQPIPRSFKFFEFRNGLELALNYSLIFLILFFFFFLFPFSTCRLEVRKNKFLRSSIEISDYAYKKFHWTYKSSWAAATTKTVVRNNDRNAM